MYDMAFSLAVGVVGATAPDDPTNGGARNRQRGMHLGLWCAAATSQHRQNGRHGRAPFKVAGQADLPALIQRLGPVFYLVPAHTATGRWQRVCVVCPGLPVRRVVRPAR
jgi:hypothetical protein